MRDLSILIPARNEEFLGITIKDILKNIEADTEIIAVLDGYDVPIPELPEDTRVTYIKHETPKGQRASTNEACRLAKADYIAKVDAHCAFDKGFDRILLADMQEDWTVVPIMRNLHAFDWVCPNGHRRYQGPSGVCKECGLETHKEMMWIGKSNPQSTSYTFDTEPHFQYFNEFKKRPEGQGDLTETMSLQGSFFMLSKKKYWELNICDESFGSWGSQGIEVACKTWLSGGKCMCNHKTWYAHMFRTQGGDFGFPYQLGGKQVSYAKKTARELFFNNKWDKQIYPLSWLIERFSPVPYWSENDIKQLKKEPTKGILFYTDNKLNMKLARTVRNQIKKANIPITCVSLKPMDYGVRNILIKEPRGYITMTKQILAGLEAMTEDIVYFCEHDVLYHLDHFKFTPEKKETWYYNGNYWMLRLRDGFAVHYNVSPLSGLVVYRESAIKHFKERLKYMESLGNNLKMLHIGFEPFTHNRIKWQYWCDYELFMPNNSNIDIAHEGNVTRKRWSQKDFRRKPKFWVMSENYSIKGWENLKDLIRFK